jgi:hypothetical protein
MGEQKGPGSPGWVTNRKKRRIPCTLWVGEREHSALILDLSPSGLFVQTHAKTSRGERLRLYFMHEDALLEIVVEVVRTKHVPQNLLAAAKGGIGVRILSAPEEYYELLASLGINERAKPTFELETPPGPRFRVYVAQIGGPRSRRVEIAAVDADSAGVRALEELGGGWKVLRVEPV